jgi:hypothetical protein
VKSFTNRHKFINSHGKWKGMDLVWFKISISGFPKIVNENQTSLEVAAAYTYFSIILGYMG